MNISLEADVARLVERELNSGRYASASDLVREGLMLLEQARFVEEESLAELRAAIAEGLADAEAGRFSSRSVREIADDVLKRHSREA